MARKATNKASFEDKKSGKKYQAEFNVPSIADLKPETIRELAEVQLRNLARQKTIAYLKEIIPSIETNLNLVAALRMVKGDEQMIQKFVEEKGLVLSIPTNFDLTAEAVEKWAASDEPETTENGEATEV